MAVAAIFARTGHRVTERANEQLDNGRFGRLIRRNGHRVTDLQTTVRDIEGTLHKRGHLRLRDPAAAQCRDDVPGSDLPVTAPG